jgi:hypothetical protein
MGLDDDRVAGSESRGCVTAGNGKGERKVAGAEDRNGPDRAKYGANVGAGERLAVRLRGINARPGPGAFFNHLRKKTKLTYGSADLSLQARLRQSRFTVRPLNQIRRDGFDAGGDVTQEAGLVSAGQFAVVREGIIRQTGCEVNIVNGGGMIDGIKVSSNSRVESLKRSSRSLAGLAIEN